MNELRLAIGRCISQGIVAAWNKKCITVCFFEPDHDPPEIFDFFWSKAWRISVILR
jgi:hypothetical protein